MAILSIFVVLSACSGSPAASPKATVMIYMIGSNLQGQDGLANINIGQMAQVGSSDNLKIVLETGGVSPTDPKSANWTTVKRQLVQPNGLQPLSDLGTIDMADPATLQAFIQWAETSYPADKYHLILWDHGGGTIRGFGADENFNNQSLTLAQLTQALSGALSATGKGFETIGFDACLMATIEVASALSPYSRYLVASEETEPGSGWDYAAFLEAIQGDPAIDGKSLGKIIADSFQVQTAGQSQEFAKAITLSVTDLSQVGPVVSALEALSGRVESDLSIETSTNRPIWLAVSKARAQTESYGNDETHQSFTDMTDLDELATLVEPTFPNEATALSSSLTQAVVYKISGSARPNSNGLSVYFPYKMSYDPAYNSVNFSASYKAMVSNYVALKDTVAPTFANWVSTSSSISATAVDDDIASAEVIVSTTDPSSGTVTILGQDVVPMDASGNVSFSWTGQWLLLNNNLISFFDIATEGSIILYDIPALLNGIATDILVIFDGSSDTYAIVGAWPGITSSGLADRDILPINPGDVITPLFLSYNLATNQTVFVQAPTPFTVPSGGLSLSIAPLSSGTYYAAFLATDYSQNEAVSSFATFVQ